MFDMRFKRIQTALADGRLDEAFDLLSDPDLRAHRTGQKLLTRLGEACIKRGQEHLAAQRLAPALEDCNRAEKLAGNTPAVQELRRQICLAIEAARLQSRQKADQLARAREQLENGMLSAGRRMLDGCEDERALLLLQNAELDQTAAQAAVKRVREALESGDLKQAIELYRRNRLETSGHEQAASIFAEIGARAAKQVRQYLQSGQLTAAAGLLQCFNGQVKRWDELHSLRQALQYCTQGARWIREGRFAQAALDLQKARRLVPEAGWIEEAVKEARQGAQALETLQTGPLGLIEADPLSETPPAENRESVKQTTSWKSLMNMEQKEFASATDRYLLQVDGIGSFPVFCGRRVTIGPVSSSIKVDLGLVVSPEAQVREIERLEGDYFLAARNETKRELLADGDRIELTPRCRMQFTLPNPASGTAVLKLSSARLPRSDIQGVLLMDREILIGPAKNCHIQSGQARSVVTIFRRNGTIFARCETGEQETIETGRPVQIGSLRFVLTEYTG